MAIKDPVSEGDYAAAENDWFRSILANRPQKTVLREQIVSGCDIINKENGGMTMAAKGHSNRGLFTVALFKYGQPIMGE